MENNEPTASKGNKAKKSQHTVSYNTENKLDVEYLSALAKIRKLISECNVIEKSENQTETMKRVIIAASKDTKLLESVRDSYIGLAETRELRLKGYNILQEQKGESPVDDIEFTVEILPMLKMSEINKCFSLALNASQTKKIQ
ncbi:hypothetical protein [Halobacteriovorax sp. ZH2_bin.1]|uniref:hypothetical protein n=1 Tax=unclassified Halobacteriovorax TaxID=2639665 RepID=UPI00371C7076